MTNQRIVVLLAAWGRWANAHIAKAVGYPSVSPMFRDTPSGVAVSSVPVGVCSGHDDMQAIDDAIRRLPGVLRMAVIEVYQFQKSQNEAGRSMGISQPSVAKYLNEAYRLIEMEMVVLY